MSIEEYKTEWRMNALYTMNPFTAIPIGFIWEYMALAEESPAGCLVEVGVYQGGAAWMFAAIARKQKREQFLYDTFTGIPCADVEAGDKHKVGDFGDTRLSDVCLAVPSALVIPGIFPTSIIPMPPVAFALIDVDQYQSTRETILALLPLMVKDGIIVFDDYGCLAGADKAVNEIFSKDEIHFTEQGKAYVRR